MRVLEELYTTIYRLYKKQAGSRMPGDRQYCGSMKAVEINAISVKHEINTKEAGHKRADFTRQHGRDCFPHADRKEIK